MARLGGVLVVAMGVWVAGCSVFGGTAADEPPYILVRAEGAVEIRDYPALVIARTHVAAPRDDAVGTGFGRLFDYISGANAGAADIAMTAPVITNPVITNPGADSVWQTAFILPPGTTLATAPRPSDPGVHLDVIAPRRVAVLRFGGLLGGDRAAEPQARLAAWLDAQGLGHRGDWQVAGYNPPWTIPALRRNEVIVTLR